jgi:hypothetical protein
MRSFRGVTQAPEPRIEDVHHQLIGTIEQNHWPPILWLIVGYSILMEQADGAIHLFHRHQPCFFNG